MHRYMHILNDISTGKKLNIVKPLMYLIVILVCYPELLECRFQCSLWFHCILAVPQVHPTSIYNLPLTEVTTRKAGLCWHIPSVGQTVMHRPEGTRFLVTRQYLWSSHPAGPVSAESEAIVEKVDFSSMCHFKFEQEILALGLFWRHFISSHTSRM